MTDLRTSRG